MNILIYVGPAPSRELVLQMSLPLVQQLAASVTLVTGGGDTCVSFIDNAAQRFTSRAGLAIERRMLEGTAQAAILEAANEQLFDLVVFGRLHQPVGRLLPGAYTTATAARLEPSVLRVHGLSRPVRRILVASGGDHHTFEDVRMAEKFAQPFGASVTLLHVLSQQPVESVPVKYRGLQFFEHTHVPESRVVHAAAEWLTNHGIETYIKGRVGLVLDEIMAELRVGSYDLLVVGAHRVSSALDRILLEDITGDLLDVSPLPVLVVK